MQGLVVARKIIHYVPEKGREIIASRFPKIGITIWNKITGAADFAL